MVRLFFITLAFLPAAPSWAVFPSESGRMPCSNRVRDFYESTQHVARMQSLGVKLDAGIATHEAAELHYQIALSAWMANPFRFYDRCGKHLDDALRLNPLHLRARQLALLHAIRGMERGDRYALPAALSHARELSVYPQITSNPDSYAKVMETCQWLETKAHGRKALRFMASMPMSAEQNPQCFLNRTVALPAVFRNALWEADDSAPELLEEIIGESVLDTLEKGLALQGGRLTALMMVGRFDEAITEYRAFASMLAGGMDPSSEQDGTHLVIPSLQLARPFGAFREAPRLVEWLRSVRKTWTQGPENTVDWIDLLLAGHLESDPIRAHSLWRTARHAFGLYRKAHPPLVPASTRLAFMYFASLLEELPDAP